MSKLIIVEGVDGTGKSTLIEGLKRIIWPDHVLHLTKPDEEILGANYAFEKGLFTGLIPLLGYLVGRGNVVVADRFHYSTFAYGLVKRGYTKAMGVKLIMDVERALRDELPPGSIKVIQLMLQDPNTAVARGKAGEGEYLRTVDEVRAVNAKYYTMIELSRLPKRLIYTDLPGATKEHVLEEAVSYIVG